MFFRQVDRLGPRTLFHHHQNGGWKELSWEGSGRLVGRLAGIADGVAQFSGSLPNVCELADLKLGRLLNTIDAWAGTAGERFAPTVVRSAPLGLNLRSGEISTIV